MDNELRNKIDSFNRMLMKAKSWPKTPIVKVIGPSFIEATKKAVFSQGFLRGASDLQSNNAAILYDIMNTEGDIFTVSVYFAQVKKMVLSVTECEIELHLKYWE